MLDTLRTFHLLGTYIMPCEVYTKDELENIISMIRNDVDEKYSSSIGILEDIIFNLKSDLDNAEEKVDYLTDTIDDLHDEIEMMKDYLH